MTKRRPELSALNVLFCLLVIFIHVISYAVSAFPQNTPRYTAVMLPWRLAAFVVQGFVMLAGIKLFLNNRAERPYSKHILSRFKGIVIPYAVSFALYYIYFMLTSGYKLDILFIIKNFAAGSLVYHMYFIPIILQFDLLLPLWKRVVNRCSPAVVLPFALLLTQLCQSYLPSMAGAVFPGFVLQYNDRLFTTYLSYWLIGCYIGKYYDRVCDILNKNYRALGVITAASTLLMLLFSYLGFNGIISAPYLNDIHYLYVIYMCVFLLASALRLPQNMFEKSPLLSRLDKSSFYIYLYHVMLIMLIARLW